MRHLRFGSSVKKSVARVVGRVVDLLLRGKRYLRDLKFFTSTAMCGAGPHLPRSCSARPCSPFLAPLHICPLTFKVVTLKHFDNDCYTLTITVLKHFQTSLL